MGSLRLDQVSHTPKVLIRALASGYPIIINAHANVDNLSVRIDALVLLTVCRNLLAVVGSETHVALNGVEYSLSQ